MTYKPRKMAYRTAAALGIGAFLGIGSVLGFKALEPYIPVVISKEQRQKEINQRKAELAFKDYQIKDLTLKQLESKLAYMDIQLKVIETRKSMCDLQKRAEDMQKSLDARNEDLKARYEKAIARKSGRSISEVAYTGK